MAKGYSSVIGIDLGQSGIKTVLLQKKGSKVSFAGYAIHPYATAETFSNPDAMAAELKDALKATGGNAKGYALASSSRETLVRIIEQPITPTTLLRDAVRVNSNALLNQDCKEYIVDCDILKMPEKVENRPAARTAMYLVAGMKREIVKGLLDVATRAKLKPNSLQIAPISTFNAFEVANPEIFRQGTFMIVDIGHQETTVVVGSRSELVLVRNIEFGGRTFIDALVQEGAIEMQAAIHLIEQGDPGMADAGRGALGGLAREVRSSIGFVEGQRDESIAKVYICGAVARADIPLQVLSNELDLPCELWDPTNQCEMGLPKNRRNKIGMDYVSLNVAFGAAWELLHKEE